MTRKKLFISYSHKDVRWFERVREQLAVLESEGLIDTFEDTRIGAGVDWYARLDQEMREARIALLLISASFLTSAFIRKEEIPKLFGQHKAAGLVLYPLLVRDCPWQEVSWLARLQMRPRYARPIAGMRTASWDKCLADVAREISSMVRAEPPHEPRKGGPTTGPFGADEFNDKDVSDVVPRTTIPSQPMMTNAPKVFLCYAREDRGQVEQLNLQLQAHGIEPWQDKQNLRTGDNWDRQLVHVINHQVNYVIVVQTPALTRQIEGYFYREIATALDRQQKIADGFRFILPVTLGGSAVLPQLRQLHQIAVDQPDGLAQLVEAIHSDWDQRQKKAVT